MLTDSPMTFKGLTMMCMFHDYDIIVMADYVVNHQNLTMTANA